MNSDFSRIASHSDATYFHNDLSNVIGFNRSFNKALNLGAAETQGVETELRAQPITDLTLTASYTYLEAVKTSSADVGAAARIAITAAAAK